MKIAIARTDKIGDFMLTWPALKCLKLTKPDWQLTAWVSSYTAELAKLCPWIDEVFVEDQLSLPKAIKVVKNQSLDVIIALRATPRVSWLAWRAKIKQRIAPASRWPQIFYTYRIAQHRSQSRQPEYSYNWQLIKSFLAQYQIEVNEPQPPYWPINAIQRQQWRTHWARVLNLNLNADWWFIHPGGGGSAKLPSISQYAQLLAMLADPIHRPRQYIITFGAAEQVIALQLAELLQSKAIYAYLAPNTLNLTQFAQLLASGEGIIAGSTGPLHIAGAMNLSTIAFYPAKRSASALRWQTCNDLAYRLAFSAPSTTEYPDGDMSALDLTTAAHQISIFMENNVSRETL